MRYMIQYLEPGPHLDQVSPRQVAQRLHAFLSALPIEGVLLGWDLPTALVEACAQEAQKAGTALYLWHPLLTAQGAPPQWPSWRAIGPTGQPVPAYRNLPEFTFLCPNHPEAREFAMARLRKASQEGPFAGVFLDRIRWPSPSEGWRSHMACFCPFCRRVAAQKGVDLAAVQQALCKNPLTTALTAMYEKDGPLGAWARWREEVISAFVREAAEALRSERKCVGLDAWSPALAPLVGQALEALSPWADWVKVMTYRHTWGPAGLPYEVAHLAWQMAAEEGEEKALGTLGNLLGLPLPQGLSAFPQGFPPQVLALEGQRACALVKQTPLWVGLDFVEIPGVCHADEPDIRASLRALHGVPLAGVILSWDGWHIPLKRLAWLKG